MNTDTMKGALPALRPACECCGMFLEIRQPGTRAQAFCGTWYDHPPAQHHLIGHTASVLLPSRELLAQLESMKTAAAA